MIEARRLRKELEIPEGVEVNLEENDIIVKFQGKEIRRTLFFPTVALSLKDKMVILDPKKFSKREKKIINTYTAHILNMFKGIQEDYEYKVEICSSHFPMSVGVENNMVVVKNFLGEKVPRKAKIREGVVAKIEGNYVVITGADKEKVGQTAANCEQSTRITNRDRRRFQDGLWIVKKGEKELL